MSSISQQLERILGADAVLPWQAADPVLQAQIGQALLPRSANPGTSSVECVVYPATIEALAETVACAHHNRWRILPCGRGSKLHWGGLTQAQLVVSTARLNHLIEFASGDLTVTAEAGLKLADLQHTVATSGQFLAVDPAYAEQATLGGIVATGDTGALRQRYGGIRDLLIGLTLVRSDGKIAKAGGRVVKNVAGYDLMKLLTGSYGTLGILAQLTFRMYPLPSAARTMLITGDEAGLAQATAALLASALTPTAVELLAGSPLRKWGGQETNLALLVRFQSIEVSVEQQAEQLAQLVHRLGLETTLIAAESEATLWQQLRTTIDAQSPDAGITCRIGVEPAKAIATLDKINHLSALGGIIHAGSGLGTIQLPLVSVEAVLQLRQLCQRQGGFLSVLSAPAAWKQQLDVWGYPGNALDLMQQLKAQFDPENILSPQRFVGQI